MNEEPLVTDNADITAMLRLVTYPDDTGPGQEFDLHAGSRAKSKYHSLLGQDQHHQRTEKTIKMSSSSSAINIYKNVQNREILNSISKTEFNS
jgi:hypothetical protein